MKNTTTRQTFNIGRAINKFLLSSFVVFSFIAYVINQRITKPDSALNSNIVTPQTIVSPQINPTLSLQPDPAVQNFVIPTSTSLATPTLPPSPTATSNGLYRDGVYTGPQIDAYYGFVEVQVSVQNGRIADVQFLQYPSDRRTSRQINSIAMPYLQQEAIQAQSAHINIISGATFTSRGFAISLNEALKSAKN